MILAPRASEIQELLNRLASLVISAGQHFIFVKRYFNFFPNYLLGSTEIPLVREFSDIQYQ